MRFCYLGAGKHPSPLDKNITGFSRDFKRARYQKLAFVKITRCESGTLASVVYLCLNGGITSNNLVCVVKEAISLVRSILAKNLFCYLLTLKRDPYRKNWISGLAV